MKDQEKIQFDSSLKDINENIHWDTERQQHVRKMFLTKLEQESVPKRNVRSKKMVLPVLATILFLGIITTLFLSENSITQQHPDSVVEHNHANQLPKVQTSEDVQSSLTEINQSTFELQLPTAVPMENAVLKNIWLRDSGDAPVVTASYHDGKDIELFTFMQEDISVLSENTVSSTIDRMKENAAYETEINGNVTFVSKNEQSGLLTINIVTSDYGFTLSSYVLSDEQLLTIGESIDAY